jgi:ketosteroid isomerase-like protein
MNMSDEESIRRLIENWAKAVRDRNVDGILAHHSPDIVMFDVPPPFQSVGIEAYRKTWDLFFSGTEPGCFDIQQLSILAGSDVAFAVALMKCSWKNGDHFEELDFRLTTGLVKAKDAWTIVHEHHSVPAIS